MYCADETDGESLRACNQVFDSLLTYKIGGTEVVPSLATDYTASDDLTEWTFNLRQGVTFSDGTPFTANDVVATYEAQWNAGGANHTGRQGSFDYFSTFFTAFLNKPAS
jgi:ABC-type transport system substrate-binding protein